MEEKDYEEKNLMEQREAFDEMMRRVCLGMHNVLSVISIGTLICKNVSIRSSEVESEAHLSCMEILRFSFVGSRDVLGKEKERCKNENCHVVEEKEVNR